MFKLILVLVVMGFAYHYGKTTQPAAQVAAATPADSRPSSFLVLPNHPNAPIASVVILAPEDCPEDGALRADAMAARLAKAGIPVTRSSSVGFSYKNADQAYMQSVANVLSGDVPVVIVRGRGKANPTADEVIAEYRAGEQ